MGAPPPAHTVHLQVQALLMEGVQRIDEMALFRERVPDDEMVPTLMLMAKLPPLDASQKKLLPYCDGESSIKQIARASGLGLFPTVKAVHGLVQLDVVELSVRDRFEEERIRELVGAFNEVLRAIFAAVDAHGGGEEARVTVEAWILGSGNASYFGEHLVEDGSIDEDWVLAAMRGVDSKGRIGATQLLHQAFSELSSFALFAATTALPREEEEALSREVNALLDSIRA